MKGKDLPYLLGSARQIFLYCPVCGAQYSAHRGDYWDVGHKDLSCCEVLLELVEQKMSLKRIK